MATFSEFGNDEVKAYEEFVLKAFELAMGKRLKRGEDPASFATTDVYYDGEIDKMRSAASYAMGIYEDYLYRHNNEDSSEPCSYDEHKQMEECFASVFTKTDVSGILAAVARFNGIIRRYID